jgi:pyruvate dehydrogenase E1 component beta subunit
VECLRAQELVADAGIHAEVIDPIWLVPLDIDTIIESVRRTGRLLVVDNGWTNCGASAEIMARVAERICDQQVRMARMGFATTACPPSPPLEHEFYPNPAKIAARMHEMVLPQASWQPDMERAALSYQLQFRGPF